MSNPTDVYADLKAENKALDQIVAGLSAAQWDEPSAAAGWTIKHQVAHLSSIAVVATIAATDPDLFVKVTAGADKDFDGAVNALLTPYLVMEPADLLARWRKERDAAAEALTALPPDQMVPWVARSIPASVLACAGLMELFAHGQDITDALGVRREYTDRIGHLAWFATRNRDFGYMVRGLTPPEAPFRFELTAPSGITWEFGPADADNKITGPALDFCLLVTRRRHQADLALHATGDEAVRWMDIAQAYRGSPGDGRQPGQFETMPAARLAG
ncbi:MAG TPA: TIGR03084 family metal-binding protein [Streptosporangiaceae bacterium]